MTNVRQKRIRSTPEVRRLALIEAGVQCIQRHGIEGFTIERISETASVSMGLISHYFDGRDGLLTAVYEHFIETLPRLPYPASSNLSDNITIVVGAIESNFGIEIYSRKNFAVWLALYAAMPFNEALRARSVALATDYAKALAACLSNVAQARSITIDSSLLASNFIAYLDGLWLQWSLSDSESPDIQKASAYAFLERCVGSLQVEK